MMTSRDRLKNALAHRQDDRAPIDFSSHRSSGIAALAYPGLRRFLGFSPRPLRIYDLVQQLAVVDDDVLDAFQVDVIEMGRGFLTEESDWKEWILPDGSPCLVPGYLNLEKRGEDWLVLSDKGRVLGMQKKGCLYFEQTHYPLQHRSIAGDDFSDLEEILPQTIWTGVPHPGAHLNLDDAGLRDISEGARRLRESSSRGIVGLFGGNMFEIPQMLYRMDGYLLSLGLHPEAVLRLSEKLCAVHLKNLEKWLGAVGPYIDVIQFGDDLGGQQGPLISPEMYRRFYKPFHQRLWKRAKELADVKVMLHCCGGIRELLEDLIDAGLDAVNPVQISARGMEAAGLKRDFGRDLVFWGGGCDTHEILPYAPPDDVRSHVRDQVNTFGPNGGFVFQQVHNILANVPPENIVAMFEAAGRPL